MSTMPALLPSQEEEPARTEEHVERPAHGSNVSSSVDVNSGGHDAEDDVVGGNDVEDVDGDRLAASIHREGLTNDVPKDGRKTLQEAENRVGPSHEVGKDEVQNVEELVVGKEGSSHDEEKDGAGNVHGKDEEKTPEEAAFAEGKAFSYGEGKEGKVRSYSDEVMEGKISSLNGEGKDTRSLYHVITEVSKTIEQAISIDCEDPSHSCEEAGRKVVTIDEIYRILIDMESRFAPFVRHDIYGRMGKDAIPVLERIRLLVAFGTIVPLRVVLLLAIVILGYSICRICTLFIPPDQIEENNGEGKHDQGLMVPCEGQENYANLCGWHRAVIVFTGKLLSRAFLFVLGFYWIRVTNIDDGFKEEAELRPAAVISNHVSYIDILYHISSVFPSFAPKRSVADLPVIGLISKCLGCVFVQREEKPSDFKGVSGVIRKRMHAAARDKNVPLMMLFPEGTTTNGFFLLPFKTGAFLAGTPIQPVVLRYPYVHFSPAWETISGVRHFFLLLCQFVNHLEVLWLPVYFPSEIERADPRLYARNVRKMMAVEGGLFMSEVGLQEKRIYHSFLNEYIFESP